MTVTLARPPRPWELQTAALLAGTAATALLTMTILGTDLALLAYLRSDGTSGMTSFVSWTLRHLDVIYLVRSLLFFCCFVLACGWRIRTKTMLRRIGAPSNAGRHWLLIGFWVSSGVIFLLGVNNAAWNDGQSTQITFDALYAAVRTVGLAFLLLGLWQIQIQVRAAVAEAGVLLRRTNLPKRSTVPSRPLPSRDAPITNLPQADDAFWSAISQQAVATGSDLALLEAAGPLSHRWHLIPKNGDITATRREIPPGAIITVFPTPPALTDPATFTPAPADKYHSFLKTPAGDLQYQSVPEKRVPAFLARAAGSASWALYLSESPGAVQALMPTPTPEPEPAT
jgi:hypothetical protein